MHSYLVQPRFSFDIFATVAFRTCVSVHRRDRCTRTLLNQGLVFDLFTTVAFVLVCLSIRDRCTSTLSYLGSVTASFTKAAFRTCVSVHRRDRCTRTLPNLHSTVSGILLHLNTFQVQLPPRFLFTGFGIFLHLTSVPVVYISTGVSVHRRDRCTCTTINQIPNSFGY